MDQYNQKPMLTEAKTAAVGTPIKVRVSVALSDVEWTRVRYALTHQFRMTREGSGVALSGFQKRCRSLVNWCWFRSQLTALDNCIAAAIADVHGGDLVTLQYQRATFIGPIRVNINQQLTLKPSFRSEGIGSCEIEVGIEWLRRVWRLRTKRDAIMFYIISALSLIVLYALAAGLILYGAAVFLLFLADPALVMTSAGGNLTIFLGLFGFLTGVAAITGQAVRNLWRRMVSPRRSV